ncbi:hypothetical protein ON010_g16209 [Phytophthora cinnamomi]|nr:hypothetical protein ON010_g16209 [Phytophthora cinnamomi]
MPHPARELDRLLGLVTNRARNSRLFDESACAPIPLAFNSFNDVAEPIIVAVAGATTPRRQLELAGGACLLLSSR